MTNDLKWMLGSDFHIPYENPKYMSLWWQVMEWFQPDVIDILGDLDDNSACSKYSDGKPDEVVSAVAVYAPLVKNFFATCREKRPDAEIHFATGNHECSAVTNTSIPTREGFKTFYDITTEDEVLSIDDNGNAVWVKIQKIHHYPGIHEVYKMNNQSVRGSFTSNHRLIHLDSHGRRVEKLMAEAYEMSSLKFITSGTNPKKDLASVSDEDIRLLAWCLTDSSVTTTKKQWVFYQSEPKHTRISDILDSLKIPYRETIRNRNITEIDGKILKKAPSPQHEYAVSAEDIPWPVETHWEIPSIVNSFSKRQFDIFLKEWQYTDGTEPTGGKGSVVIYCSVDKKRRDLMTLLIQNAYSVSETEYRTGHWRLNISDKTSARAFWKGKSGTPIEKTLSDEEGVFCITVETGTFFMESGGSIHLTGNSRYDDYIERKGKALKGLITPEILWGTDTHGIDLSYYNNPPVHRFGDIYVHHGPYAMKDSGATAMKMIDEFGVSCIVGHCFSADTEILTDNGWKRYTDINVGTSVMTLNRSSKSYEYQEVSDKYVYDTFKELVKIENDQVDLMVTHGHGMVYIDRDGEFRETIAGKMPGKNWLLPSINGDRLVKSEDISVIPYEDNVWCVTVPNHTLVVRRNGKVVTTMNTHRQSNVYRSYPLRGEVLRSYELGHMTDIYSSGMAYDRKHDWQPGFAIAHIVNDYPHISLISINNDFECVVDGKLFKA